MIGQDVLKRTLAVALHNHHARIRVNANQQTSNDPREGNYTFSNGYLGSGINVFPEGRFNPNPKHLKQVLTEADDNVLIEKSNVLLLGPTGSGMFVTDRRPQCRDLVLRR